jgi:hypothetical protein
MQAARDPTGDSLPPLPFISLSRYDCTLPLVAAPFPVSVENPTRIAPAPAPLRPVPALFEITEWSTISDIGAPPVVKTRRTCSCSPLSG